MGKFDSNRPILDLTVNLTARSFGAISHDLRPETSSLADGVLRARS